MGEAFAIEFEELMKVARGGAPTAAEGHVDEPGNSAERARELSRRRAETVKKALVELGVASERLQTRAYGYSKLLDRSETPAAQKRNNRIEIVVNQ